MNRKNLLLVLSALLLVLLGNWLTEEGVKRVAQKRLEVKTTQHDYYLSGVAITTFDAQGLPQHQVQARQLGHNELQQSSIIEQPQLQLFSGGKLQWQVSAARGTFEQQHDRFLLEGDVTMQQGGGESPLRLSTSSLLIQPGRGSASTEQPVTLQQGENRIDAVGMQIEGQGERLQLLSNVRAKYATQIP